MKKSYILALSALLTVVSLSFASSEKLTVYNKWNIKEATVPVEDIKDINYTGDGSIYNKMNIRLKDGSVKSFSLDNVTKVEYTAPLPESKLNVEFKPHYNSASVNVKTQSDVYWRVVGCTASELASYNHSEWGDVLVQDNLKGIIGDAEYYNWEIADHMDYYFFKGSHEVDWWHSSKFIDPGTEVVIVAYSVSLENGKPVMDAEPVMYEGKTKELTKIALNFDIKAEMTSNTITVKADASDPDMPFYVTLYSENDFTSNSLNSLIQNSVSQIENFAYTNNMTWGDVVSYGHSETKYVNRISGEKWVAVAFGVEYGVVYSEPQYKVFEIPAAEIVDKCTFDVTATQLGLSEFSLDVTPSSNGTRYIALLANANKFEDGTSYEQYVAKRINYHTVTKAFDWSSSDYIHQGKSSLNTKTDMLEGEYLNYGESYYALIFGVDKIGTRTTAIKAVEITPAKDGEREDNDLTFTLECSNFDASDYYMHELDVKVTPSDLDAKYVYVCLPASNYSVDNTRSDEEIIKDYITIEGANLRLLSGVYSTRQSFTSWGVWNNYRIMIFGYDGEATSAVYMYEVNTETGDVTQIRPTK